MEWKITEMTVLPMRAPGRNINLVTKILGILLETDREPEKHKMAKIQHYLTYYHRMFFKSPTKCTTGSYIEKIFQQSRSASPET